MKKKDDTMIKKIVWTGDVQIDGNTFVCRAIYTNTIPDTFVTDMARFVLNMKVEHK